MRSEEQAVQTSPCAAHDGKKQNAEGGWCSALSKEMRGYHRRCCASLAPSSPSPTRVRRPRTYPCSSLPPTPDVPITSLEAAHTRTCTETQTTYNLNELLLYTSARACVGVYSSGEPLRCDAPGSARESAYEDLRKEVDGHRRRQTHGCRSRSRGPRERPLHLPPDARAMGSIKRHAHQVAERGRGGGGGGGHEADTEQRHKDRQSE